MATKKIDPLGFRKLSDQEIRSIQAVWAGQGSENDQRLALNTIMTVFAKYPKTVPYSPGEPDESTFLAGRFFVGQCVAEIIEKPFNEVAGVTSDDDNEQPNG